MFWISKKIVTYQEIWKEGFLDLHNHLLPGIDDGSKSIDQTKKMIEGMKNLGITESIATPHTYPGLWDNKKEDIENAYQSISDSFIKKCSSEYFADEYLINLAISGELLTLKDNYILIEFSMMGPPNDNILDTLFQLKLKDYRIILAHPERYQYWDKDLKLFEQLKSFDLSFQLNALSILGYYGNDTQKTAEYLLKNDFYDFLGTDFHNLQQIEFTKNNSFNTKFSTKIETLVEANSQFK